VTPTGPSAPENGPAERRVGHLRIRWPQTPAARLTAAGIGAVTLVYAFLVWERRWISDDGLIVVRTARQIVAGNGPVYNTFERAEASTSAIWTWLLAAVGWVTDANVARLAVVLGGLLAVCGLAIALDATRRFHRDNGHTGVLLPAGALVILAVFPFWDFATSGLETGLAFCWLAAIWWLLVTLRPDRGQRRPLAFAVVVGVGPLVRPEFALVTIVFLVAGWQIVRPPWKHLLSLGGAALCAPLAYEIFRAGYYGSLVPCPALAKSAAAAEWGAGFFHLKTFVRPHLLYVPVTVLTAVVVLERRTITARRFVLAAPVIAAVLLAVFIVRVGGDFMHGRLWLPSTLLLAAPTLVIPRSRVGTSAVIVLAAWAMFTGIRFYSGTRWVLGNERAGYARYLQEQHPTTEAPYIRVSNLTRNVEEALRTRSRLVIAEAGDRIAMNPAYDAPIAVVVGRLGSGGAVAPLDGIVVDTFGLANPFGARITRTQPGSIGHEKSLPWAWVFADFADPSVTTDDPIAVNAARHAMSCGELAELFAAVRAPMTAARFWANLIGALRRTRLVIPADPVDAEKKFCRP
jgi:arabinofuranosyltransferase